jgi:hypothetical protein
MAGRTLANGDDTIADYCAKLSRFSTSRVNCLLETVPLHRWEAGACSILGNLSASWTMRYQVLSHHGYGSRDEKNAAESLADLAKVAVVRQSKAPLSG